MQKLAHLQLRTATHIYELPLTVQEGQDVLTAAVVGNKEDGTIEFKDVAPAPVPGREGEELYPGIT
jgi:hypothetical protein